jgi:cation diffusion facilitator family transporter
LSKELQKRRESALIMALSLDGAMLFLYLVIGIWAGSITILAEAIRGGLLLIVGLASLVTLRRIHRGQLGPYDYGAGKLEQSLTVAIGFLLIVSAALLFWRLTGLEPVESRTFGQAAFSITSVTVNLIINASQLWFLHKASRGGDSVIMTAQYWSRWVKTVASFIVVLTVSYAMVADDPSSALVAEQLGTLLVVAIMIGTGAAMIKGSLPDLLDRSLPEAMQFAINRVLAANIDGYEQIGRVRSRRSGNTTHVEIEVFLSPVQSMQQASDFAAKMEEGLKRELPGTDPVIILRSMPPIVSAPTSDAAIGPEPTDAGQQSSGQAVTTGAAG